MPAPASRMLSFRAGLLFLLAALVPASLGGCSALIDGQLSEKSDETAGDGGLEGGDGQGGESSSSSSSSGNQNGTNPSSSSSGGALMCASGFLDCDGDAHNGCEIHVADDPQNCGACKHVCE